MNSLGVICSPHNNKNIKLAGGIEKVLPNSLRKYALEITPVLHKTVTLEKMGLKVEEIQLPFMIANKDEIAGIRFQRALNRVKKVLNKKGIAEIIFDEEVHKMILEEGFLGIEDSFKIFYGTDFCSMYIIEILKYICKKVGVSLQKLSVTVMLDEMDDFFKNILKDLCTKVRFLSIISLDSEKFIPVANEIYSEIGLVVRLEKSIKTKKGDYGILINFSKDKEFINSNRFSRNYIVLNLGAEIYNNNHNGILVTDIIIKSNRKDSEKYSWMEKPAFCEALGYRLAGEGTKDKAILLEKQKRIIAGLKAEGYKLCGVKGVRGEIKAETLAEFGEKIKSKIV
ncbi:MAG: hypothetical protein ACM3KR_03780 [Deltaproteobacteria bacterium]